VDEMLKLSTFNTQELLRQELMSWKRNEYASLEKYLLKRIP
jgi:hypothetical protein